MAKIITKEMEKCAYNKKSPLLTSAVSKLLNKQKSTGPEYIQKEAQTVIILTINQ